MLYSDKIFFLLLVYLTSFTVFSGDIKKRSFSEFVFFHWSFSELFFLPSDPKSEKNPLNQLIKKL